MKELINRKELKTSLLKFMKENPQSIRYHSKHIGITSPTLKGFLLRDTGDYRTLGLIDNFLEKFIKGYVSARK